MSYWEGLDDQLRWLEPNDLNLEYEGVSHLDCVSRVLICTSEFFKKLKLHEPLRRVQFRFLKNSQVQINSKLNEKNRMITY